MTKRLTESEIAISIVPMHLGWPEAGASAVWRRLHECVQQLHEFAQTFDNNCVEIEQRRELGGDEIRRRRTEVGQEAMTKLANFRPLEIAEQAAAKEINTMAKRGDLTPQEAQAKQRLIKARDELRAGKGATQRLLLERCRMREGPVRRPVYY